MEWTHPRGQGYRQKSAASPAPPPDVEPIDPDVRGAKTLKQLRKAPNCGSLC